MSTRIILILTLMLAMASGVFAQETERPAAAAQPAEETTTANDAADAPAERQEVVEKETPSAYQIRTQLGHMIRRHASELGMVLALEPTLIANESFLSGYPDVAAFVAEHPEIRRSPRFYLAEFPVPGLGGRNDPFDDLLEGMLIFSVVAFIAFVLAWLVRTVIEQRRWSRLSRTQTEVHTKILDRFGSTEELLQYARTPAGARFLESAPIPLHVEQPAQNAPMNRIMWSIQLGVVVALGALGMLLVSFRFEKEGAQALFAMGTIAFCVGTGFIAAAGVSLLLSRRLGLWQAPAPPPIDGAEDPGRVR